MNRYLSKFILLSLICFSILAQKTQAATTTPSSVAFTFVDGSQSFPISNELLSAWQGREVLYPSKAFAPQAQSFKDSLLGAVGRAQEMSQDYKTYDYRLAPIYDYINSLAKNLDKPEADPVLEIQNGRATNFTPPQNGSQVDVYKSALDTLQALQIGNMSVTLTDYQTSAQKNLADTNNLGINELIAEGVSTFNGSPKNRRFNIAVGTEKFKGIIVPKGAEFSFDDILGPVEADSGFLPELVIDNGQTLPEFGGGLCQVSTTAFRAAMAAGLPITARRNHAYAVQYYSPQGTDATIYPGSADLKFINDTPGAILIWPYEKDANTLVFDFYGTKDTRQVTLEKPVVYDRQTSGAMKATWTRDVVMADGTKRTDVFKSNYQAPALFHKTETFVSATGTQATGLHVGT